MSYKRNNTFRKILFISIVIGCSITAAMIWMHVTEKKINEVAYSDFFFYCKKGNVKHVTIYDNYLIAAIVLHPDLNKIQQVTTFCKVKIHPNHLSFVEEIKNYTTVTFKTTKVNSIFQGIFNVILNAVMLFITFYILRKMLNPEPEEQKENGDNMQNTPNLYEVVGFGTIKDNIINFLRYWTKIISDPQHSQDFLLTVLFKGEPGTGKTFMANVMAKSTGAKFIKIDISGIGSPFIHQTSRNIQKCFDKARQLAEEGNNVILFIDEIDSIAAPRRDTPGSSGNEHVEVVTTILKNISGLRSPNEKRIMVVCATNNDNLDPAFHSRVSSSFDFSMPNMKDRKELINFYIKNDFKDCDWPTDLDLFSKLTEDSSQRKIKTIMLNASVQAKSRCVDIKGRAIVNLEDLFEAMISTDKSQEYWVSDDEKMSIAMHESGHALVGHFLYFHGFLPLAVNAIGMTVGKSKTTGGVTFFGVSDFSPLTEEDSHSRLIDDRYASIAWCIVGIGGKIGEMFYFSINEKKPDSIVGWTGDMIGIIRDLSRMYRGGTDILEIRRVCLKIASKLQNKLKKAEILLKRKESHTYIKINEGDTLLAVRNNEAMEDENLLVDFSEEHSILNMLEKCTEKDILSLTVDNELVPLIPFNFFSIVTEVLKRDNQPIDDLKTAFFVKNIRLFWVLGNLISHKNLDTFFELSYLCKDNLISEGGHFTNILNKITISQPIVKDMIHKDIVDMDQYKKDLSTIL